MKIATCAQYMDNEKRMSYYGRLDVPEFIHIDRFEDAFQYIKNLPAPLTPYEYAKEVRERNPSMQVKKGTYGE